jgi:hypothetical protein
MPKIFIGIGGSGANVINDLAKRAKINKSKSFQSLNQYLIIDTCSYKTDFQIDENHYIYLGGSPISPYLEGWALNSNDPFKKWWPENHDPGYIPEGSGQ